ncbi:hypothetical protein [Natrononativus amylolyticus]|uniref:hypothetical protein n=1 Tax=Natrononativus amylolyticus TaxID=2963434 RepID=UPI0020CDA331|nr:hypothetical protein [Natrononativus amylolyticus]
MGEQLRKREDSVDSDVRGETNRVDQHLEKALEATENEQAKYHLREALGLLRLE